MAYPVSTNYRTVIYSGGAKNIANLTIGGITIDSSNIKKITISSPIIDTTVQYFYLGTFIANKIEIEFKNADEINLNGRVYLEIGTYVDGDYEYVPIGYFNIDTSPEDYYNNAKITCMDDSVKFKPNIDISQFFTDGYITAENLLIALTEYYLGTGKLGTYPTLNKDKIIASYDNTLSGKYYISCIAEIMGGNAKLGRDGKLYIIPMKQTSTIEIDVLSSKNWKLSSIFSVSRVFYENLTRKYEFGATTNSSICIRPDNPFINGTDEEMSEVIENIYNNINGLEIYSLKIENYGDPSLDCFDIIGFKIDTNYFYAYNDNILTFEMNMSSTINPNLPSKEVIETTSVISNSQILTKVIKTTVDQINNTLTTTVSTVNGLDLTVNNNYQELNNKFDGYVPTSDFVTLENSVTQIQTDTYTKTEINTKLTDGSVTKVQTTSGTFDENGMTYNKTGAKTSTTINEIGIEVDDATGSGNELLFAGYDETINQTIVRTDNLTVKKYFVLGNNSRMEDYGNGGGIFIL